MPAAQRLGRPGPGPRWSWPPATARPGRRWPHRGRARRVRPAAASRACSTRWPDWSSRPPGTCGPPPMQAHACVWGGAWAPTPLLDWLGVAPPHRFRRESVLDAEDEARAARTGPARPARSGLGRRRPPDRGRPAGRRGRPGHLGARSAEVRRRQRARAVPAPHGRAARTSPWWCSTRPTGSPRPMPRAAWPTWPGWSRPTACPACRCSAPPQ